MTGRISLCTNQSLEVTFDKGVNNIVIDFLFFTLLHFATQFIFLALLIGRWKRWDHLSCGKAGELAAIVYSHCLHFYEDNAQIIRQHVKKFSD